jgi:hypothetical protein
LCAREIAIQNLGTAVHGNDVFDLLPRAGRDAFDLVHDVRIDVADSGRVLARPLPHLIEREPCLTRKRRQINLQRACDAIRRLLAMTSPAVVSAAFYFVNGERTCHGFARSQVRG